MKSLEDNLFLIECLQGKKILCVREVGKDTALTVMKAMLFGIFFFIDHYKNVNFLHF